MDQRPSIMAGNLNGIPGSADFKNQPNQAADDEVDLMEIVTLLLHHAWIIILAALIGALLVGMGVSLFVPTKYTANSTIYVFSTEGETSTAMLTQADRMTADFQIIATTRTTASLVIEELGLDMSVEQLREENKINVSNPKDSHMLRISVTNRDPAKAAQISNALASVMCDQIAYIMKSDRPQFVEPAVMGTKSSPSIKRDAALGGIAFALIAMAFVIVRYFNNDTITTEDDVNKYLGLTILSSVPLERNMARQQ